MEQIKASIAAEKNKPKKEIKSRLAPLLAAPVPRKMTENTPTGRLIVLFNFTFYIF
ncbi:unnamed protein product [Enterobius vermicularis]|uniref:Uncharacterized protein n=1 Tax=Enterobius vermicularis TaxID=51028 RepID=A0A0N4V3G7_ENTVE|nr:unnamed protein product [Enterobius vermicularis]